MNMVEESYRMSRVVSDTFDKWDEKDQMAYCLALMNFLDSTRSFIDKYDITKPFKLEIRRLD